MPPFQPVKASQQGEGRGQEFGARQNPYLPPGPKPLIFEVFNGCNNNTTRPGVTDDQMYWCDGYMPIGARNLRTLYGIGPVSYTASGTTVVFFDFVNIGSTPYMVVFLADGSVVAVNTTSLVPTTVLTAGTITAPSITTVGMTQWGNEYLIIVADQTDGYWVWDGALAFEAGQIAPVVEIVSVGGGYGTVTPTLTVIGGSGTGASLAASISYGQLVSVSVVNGGSGYLATDEVSVAIVPTPTGGSGGSVSVTGTLVGTGNGSVSGITIIAGGTNYTTPTLTFSRVNTTVPAQAVVTSVVNGTISAVSLTNSGVYVVTGSFGTIKPTVVITDAGVAATVSIHLMPFGVQGHAAETYSGHVWVADGATMYYSAPGAVDDFATSNGGGNFTANDSNLKVQYTQLISANGFLYLIADSSVSYISGVQTTGTPPVTSFTNQNADPEVGSPYPQSVIPFGRNVLMANSYGVHAIMGGAVRKVSEMMDGVYSTVASFGGLQLASAQATIFGNRVWMVLVKLVDPVSGSTVNKILMWDGGEKWWATSQEIEVSYIKHQEINSVITAYGTNGTVIHPMFQQASGSLSKVVQSRLYDAPGGAPFRKASSRYWSMNQYYSTVSPNIMVSVDNENGTQTPFTITGPSSIGFFVSPPNTTAQSGVLTGLTIRTSAADMSLISALLQDGVIEYRG